jgi:hypothetical protein
MTYDTKVFDKFQEQEGRKFVGLGDDAKYLVKGLDSVPMLHEAEREHRERHFQKILWSEASRERLFYIYIHIYIALILKKHAKRQISCRIYDIMKTCTFVH